ncbi:hypothetical protein QYE76_036431 [Lolium multiflorum]|uniref:E2 ubiquitin-conjugating enzyme n=1 Tax=Lolium multiflorum TaxID=4521 RepID=A0AAD8R0Z1_LOLMU|nr:hypothetical protein QYE76_036431 [Lolium multiflorum]
MDLGRAGRLPSPSQIAITASPFSPKPAPAPVCLPQNWNRPALPRVSPRRRRALPSQPPAASLKPPSPTLPSVPIARSPLRSATPTYPPNPSPAAASIPSRVAGAGAARASDLLGRASSPRRVGGYLAEVWWSHSSHSTSNHLKLSAVNGFHAGTPYENGIFRMKLILSRDFPHSPPKGFFTTKIFHPNIATSGEICVNTLKKDWNPSLGLRHVLLVVRCLLIEPFPESALNEQAGKLLLENYEDFARHARLYTSIHALRPKNKSKSSAALNKDQPHTILAPISTSTATKAFGLNSQDQNAAPSTVLGGASAAPKKDGPLSVKVPVDKKKMDARKKSLKRL